MSSIAISLITLACVFGGALLGVRLRRALPQDHLSADSKDTVKVGMGLVGSMAVLGLSLMVASAKSSFDAQTNELIQLSANIVMIDRVLAHYGPEAKEARDLLRGLVVRMHDRLWSNYHSGSSGLEPASDGEPFYDEVRQLLPKDDNQRSLQNQALNMATSAGQMRWLMYEQSVMPLPFTLLVVMVFWLTIIFISFGVFAPRQATAIASLFVCALSVSCAILLILEMYAPFGGLIQISDAPLNTALAHLGQ